jgi:dynein heavy chain
LGIYGSFAVAGGGTQSRDNFVDNTAHDILRKLPPVYEMDILRKKYGLTPSPTTIVLLQEVERFNGLIERIKKTLSTLRRAIAGEVGMDAVLDNVSNCLYNGLIPETWLKLAPATRKPLGSWINHFFRRFHQYEQWVCQNTRSNVKPTPNSLSLTDSFLYRLILRSLE